MIAQLVSNFVGWLTSKTKGLSTWQLRHLKLAFWPKAACGRDSSTVAEGSPTKGARNVDSDIRDGECVRGRG